MGVTRPLPVLEPGGFDSKVSGARGATAANAATLPRYRGRILVTGASGFVGSNLASAFRAHNLVGVTGFTHPPQAKNLALTTERTRVDLREAGAIERLVADLDPDAVIHVAGNKNVRFCERNPAEAEAINVTGTRNVARACKRVGAKLVYISTDLVFDGEQGGYDERSTPGPTTVYGRTKRHGEEIALASDSRALVCRTGGVYGIGSPLLDWLGRELGAGHAVDAFQDVVSTPTLVDDLATLIDVALATDACGIAHMVGREAVTRYDWFSAFAAVFGYDRQLLMPAVAGSRRGEMFLPRDVSLDARATEARLRGYRACGVRAGLERLARASRAARAKDSA